jgi:hypothetical protein
LLQFLVSLHLIFLFLKKKPKKKEREIYQLIIIPIAPDRSKPNGCEYHEKSQPRKKEEKITPFYPARYLIQSGRQHGRKQQLLKKMLHPTMPFTNYSTSNRTITSIAGFLPFNPSLRQRWST